ncbi:MAG TPA: rRNA maturation RNase YbeY [Burkholderiaceae bacterium]|nr:rRNA maturation RNase YbeY [Burkholderiaceae bacterium]HPE01599.1 rRNA maturation RNase YbeY [Burkholderiaceae bacterium]HRZ00874.1 rRNA maturation RNase YbeY [Burkholderiaceae bacterium]
MSAAPRLALSLQGATDFDALPVRATLRRWVARALERDAELTLRFVAEAEARALNRAYRRKSYAPDVLTFDYAHAPVVQADIVICVPVAAREAAVQDKPWRQHLAHLVVHGVLHAQGYDHESDRDAARMEAREVAILASLRVPDPYSARS